MSSGSVRKGSWTQEEDTLLRQCIQKYGEGKWHQVPHRSGLNRCRKSCRLRWLNYLRPNIKRGSFSLDEVDLIIRLHKLLGNRWSLIAGRLPGRTANDVKNHWNTHIKKKLSKEEKGITMEVPRSNSIVIKPRPRTFSKNSPWLMQNAEQQANNPNQLDCRQIINHNRDLNDNDVFVPKSVSALDEEDDDEMQWLENLSREMMSGISWSEEIWGGVNGGGDDNTTLNDFTNFCI